MKDLHVVGKKMTKNGQKMVKKWPFMSHKFSRFFLPKLKKKMQTEKFLFSVVAFDPIEI